MNLPKLKEIDELEEQLKDYPPANGPDVATLKTILREGLAAFETLLEKLPLEDREAALWLYFEKLRVEAYQLHVAVLTVITKREKYSLRRSEMLIAIQHYADQLKELSRIYRFL